MGKIVLERVEKWFDALQVIKGVDLEIDDGELVIFVGPSGCGKSTLLRLVAGLEEATVGRIVIDGRDVTALPPSGRGLSMVFQSYALYPHMTVRDNIAFPLRMAGVARSEVDQKVGEAARVLKLDQLLNRRPKELSGGQRQRVAIGRSIVRDPTAFLFDEPLSNLDAALRVEMRLEIAKLHQELTATMIYVTHDQVEAMTLADKIVVLQAGEVEQVGAPLELYRRPANLFVAQFIGSPKMNVMPCAVDGGAVTLAGNPVPEAALNGGRRPVRLGARPEHIHVVEPGTGHVDGEIEVAEHLGSDTFLHVAIATDDVVTVRESGDIQLRARERVGLRLQPDRIHLFDDAGLAIRDDAH